MDLQASTGNCEKEKQNLNDIKIASIVYNTSKSKAVQKEKLRVNYFNSNSLYAQRTCKKSFECISDDKLRKKYSLAQSNADECLEQYFVSDCHSKTPEKRIKECKSTNSSRKDIDVIEEPTKTPEKCKSKIK